MAYSNCNIIDFFHELLVIDELCSGWLGGSPLRADAKLFLLIAARGSVTIKEAMHSSALSNRSFYQLIDRLKKEKKVMVVPDQQDRRVHRLVLDQTLASVPSVLASKLSDIVCQEKFCRLKSETIGPASLTLAATVSM